MAKMTKLQRSQRAHRRLCNKYNKMSGRLNKDKAFYHDYCHDRQNRIARVLTPGERKAIWNSFELGK